MISRTILAGTLAMSAVGLFATPAIADSFSIGINIGDSPPPQVVPPPHQVVVPAPAPVVVEQHPGVVVVPQPPVVLAAPPRIVAVPGTSVLHAPHVGFNLFVYGGRYYSFHNGAWFYAARHDGRWVHVNRERVPRAVLAVPVAYYRIPPGHTKKHGDWQERGHGHGHGPKHKHRKWHDDD